LARDGLSKSQTNKQIHIAQDWDTVVLERPSLRLDNS
jgi:hypothetical protein